MSNSKTTKRSLFSEFPPISTEEWEKAIAKDLKGADYKKKLQWDTGEGISSLPFYRRENLSNIERRTPVSPKNKKNNRWEICEPIFGSDISSANKTAKNALKRGASSLQIPLKVRRTEGALGGDLEGIPIQDQESFSQLFDDISLDEIPLHFDSGMASPALLAMLYNEAADRSIDAKLINATFLYDPFTFTLFKGQSPKISYDTIQKDIAQIASFTTEKLPGVRPLGIDARTYHLSGGTIVQELGYALAAASEYLATLTDMDFEIDDVSHLLHFKFGVGSKYFLEIAKFRAARLLWKNLISAFDGNTESSESYIHAETSRWNKTLYDPYTNMLRATTEDMSAAIAGCDSITVLPFDEHFRQPSDFSKRTARNSQLILSEEAHLDKVVDPSAGSYYVENLTEKIGHEAWKLFQEIEQEGGLMKAIKNGTVQSAIQESQEARNRTIATRGRIFVGTNQYPNADENMSDNIETPYQTVALNESDDNFDLDIQNLPADLADAFSDGATISDIISCLFDYGKHYIRTISPYRGTQAFEELRLATEESGYTPNVLTLPLGDPRMRKARSGFAGNFFGCVGYDIEDPIGYENVEEAMKAIREQDPDIAVICSSDKEYEELVPAFTQAFDKLADRPLLVLAGYPKDKVESYKKAGIDEFIYAGSNVLESLKRFQQKLGIIKTDK